MSGGRIIETSKPVASGQLLDLYLGQRNAARSGDDGSRLPSGQRRYASAARPALQGPRNFLAVSIQEHPYPCLMSLAPNLVN